MTTIDSHQLEEFLEATNNWNLEKLYIDLASAKGKALTPVEKKFLRGLLCGCSPAEIATIVYQSRNSSTVRVYLSNGLYKYIEEMLTLRAGSVVKVKNWSRVTYLLEKAGYKLHSNSLHPAYSNTKIDKEQVNNFKQPSRNSIQDWGEAVDVSNFYGRKVELTKVQQWVVQEKCRLVVVLGMGGIGKTAFSVKLAQQLQEQFDYVIWRSLRLAPTLEQILDQLITVLAPESDSTITATPENKISQLLYLLRSSRCLIILDEFDSIFTNENQSIPVINSGIKNHLSANLLSPIKYHLGYEIYGELIRRIGSSQHQSCLILSSREKPQEISSLEGEKLAVRSLKLTGLQRTESLLILKDKGLNQISEQANQLLLHWYAGNPLFLKLLATAIQELFNGNVAEFTKQDSVVLGDIRSILDQQFNRLSHIEKYLMYALAINQGFVSIRQLQANNIPGLELRVSQRLILEAVDLLQKRSLLERQGSSFSAIPVLKEYLMERLMGENVKLSSEQNGNLLINQTILTSHLQKSVQANYDQTET